MADRGRPTSMRIALAALALAVLAACGSKDPAGAPISTTAPPTTAPSVGGRPTAPSTKPRPELDSAAASWRYNPSMPEPERVAALQTALGGMVMVAVDPPQSWSFSPSTPSAPPSGATDPQELLAGVLTAMTWDPTSVTMTVSPDGRTVTGTEQLGGVPSPLPFILTVDGNGRIVTASGHLDVPTNMGDQARIGTTAALGRLASDHGGDNRGETQPSFRPDPTPAVPPLSTGPTTEPTVVDNLLRPPLNVAETYVQTPAVDGGAWLLPAYRFSFDDGTTRTVLAVAGTPDTSPTADPSGLVGVPEDQAMAQAAANGWVYRVAERDGAQLMLTADYSDHRVNVAILNGVVVRAWIG